MPCERLGAAAFHELPAAVDFPSPLAAPRRLEAPHGARKRPRPGGKEPKPRSPAAALACLPDATKIDSVAPARDRASGLRARRRLVIRSIEPRGRASHTSSLPRSSNCRPPLRDRSNRRAARRSRQTRSRRHEARAGGAPNRTRYRRPRLGCAAARLAIPSPSSTRARLDRGCALGSLGPISGDAARLLVRVRWRRTGLRRSSAAPSRDGPAGAPARRSTDRLAAPPAVALTRLRGCDPPNRNCAAVASELVPKLLNSIRGKPDGTENCGPMGTLYRRGRDRALPCVVDAAPVRTVNNGAASDRTFRNRARMLRVPLRDLRAVARSAPAGVMGSSTMANQRRAGRVPSTRAGSPKGLCHEVSAQARRVRKGGRERGQAKILRHLRTVVR